MKCISVGQPFASAIVLGLKQVENRTWNTRHRGPLLIHAPTSRQWMSAYRRVGMTRRLPDRESLVFGALVGRVELVDVVRVDAVKRMYPRHFDEIFVSGPWCWILDDPVVFDEPIRYRGNRCLFDVSANVIEQR